MTIKHIESHTFQHWDGYDLKVGTGREDIEISGNKLDVQIVETADNSKHAVDSDFHPVEVIIKLSGKIKMSRTREEWFGFWEEEYRNKKEFQQIKILE